MINLISGSTGSGKSAFCLTQMLELIEEGRPLFVHGIPKLTLVHTLVICKSPLCDVCPIEPVEPVEPLEPPYDCHDLTLKQHAIDLNNYKIKFRRYEKELAEYNKHLLAEDWDKWSPEGALLIYDEVHFVYPTKADTSPRPDSIALLTTHRHHGLDFFLMTQSPLLFDKKVRLLVGKHTHITSTWSGRYQYEFPKCQDSLNSLSTGVKSTYKLNKKVFGMYESSSLHTKQTKKIPMAVYALPVLLLVIVLIGFRVNQRKIEITEPTQITDIATNTNLIPSDPFIYPDSNIDIQPEELNQALIYEWASNGIPQDQYHLIPPTCTLSKTIYKCPPFSIPTEFYKKTSLDRMCIKLVCYVYIKLRKQPDLIFNPDSLNSIHS